MTLYEAFLQAAARAPGHPALIELDTGLSFAELRDRIGRLSNLYQAEIPRGENVAMLSGSSIVFTQTLFAVSNSGSPLLILDASESDESLIEDLRELQVTTMLVSSSLASRAQEIIRREKLKINIIEIEKKRAGEYDTSFRALPERQIRDTDPVLIFRQGGGGVDRKFSAFTHKQVHASCMSVRRFYRLTPTDRMLTTMSWSHPFALTHGLLLPLLSGSTCVVDPESPSVEEFVNYLAAQRVTRFVGAPQFYFQLLSYCAAQKYTLPGVKSITVGMGSISLALRKTYQLLKIPVLRCYGRTEAVWSLAMDEVDGALDVENTRSKPVQGVRMAVLTEDGEEIPGPGRREGRLAVMSETLTSAYFHPEKKARSEHFHGTWLHTDDVARLEGRDEQTSVAVLGKISDMLFVQGSYLSSRRIDASAAKLGGVEEGAGFVRLSKNVEPEFACALVMKAGKFSEKDLLDHIRAELPNEFHPGSVHIVDSIPRDAFGGVNRLALQRMFSDK